MTLALALPRGCSNAEIAAEGFMAVATVKAYVSRLLTKLDLNNPVQIDDPCPRRRSRLMFSAVVLPAGRRGDEWLAGWSARIVG